MKKFIKISLLSTSILIPTQALAVNGYLMLGSGEKLGTAGAGVAKAMDGTDASVNPALIARLPNHFIVAAGIFHPERFMDTSRATAATPVGGLPIGNATRGRQWSAQENFPDGSAAVVFNREK